MVRVNFNASIENFGHREMLPHEYHEFRLFAEGSVIPPEHRLMLVNFHPECISDAKKSPVGPRHMSCYFNSYEDPADCSVLFMFLSNVQSTIERNIVQRKRSLICVHVPYKLRIKHIVRWYVCRLETMEMA